MEWFALETNRDYSVVFEIVFKYHPGGHTVLCSYIFLFCVHFIFGIKASVYYMKQLFLFFFLDQEGLFCLLLDGYEKLLTGVGWDGGPRGRGIYVCL